jgi:hypothetical protein
MTLKPEVIMPMSPGERKEMLEARVRTYFEGCNEANREKLYECFAKNVVYYFPPGVGAVPMSEKRPLSIYGSNPCEPPDEVPDVGE